MFQWIGNAVSNIGSWLGDGIASLANWLFGGLQIVLTRVIDAADGFWRLMESIFNFGVSLKDSVIGLFTTFFPFVPAAVATVLSLGLVAILIAGIYKKVRNG